MAQIVVDNGTLLSIEGKWTNGQPVVNTFFFYREEYSPQDAARDVLNNWQDHIVPMFINNYSVVGIRYMDINELDGAVGFLNADPAKPTAGPGTTSTFPPALSTVVSKNISGGRNRRNGRLYLPPPQENEGDEDGKVLASRITAINTGFATFHAGTDDQDNNEHGGHIGVLHQVQGQPITHSRVISYTCKALLGTQRRRMSVN